MTQQIINVGAVANDGTGTPLRTAFEYINDNFDELYANVGIASSISNGTSTVRVVSSGGNVVTSVGGTSNVIVVTPTSVLITGNATLSGNILTAGLISATSTITGGNVLTAGLMSSTGNIIGGNLSAVNLVINNITSDDSSFVTIKDGVNVNGEILASGNITGGNIATAGLVSATGNVTGGNITTVSRVISTPTALANLTAVAGARAFVNNGNLVAAGNFGAQIGSGGANTVPVWSDGTNWYIG
jgi:hypothetical protein